LLSPVLHGLIDPRHVAGVIAPPGVFLHADGGLAEGDGGLGRALAEGDDAFGFGFDDRLTQCVLDGHRFEVTGALAAGLRCGGVLAPGSGGEGEGDDRSRGGAATRELSWPVCPFASVRPPDDSRALT